MFAQQDVSSSSRGPGTAYEVSTETHRALSAWFMGPKAENSQVMKDLLGEIVDRVTRARSEYFPNDPAFITSSTQDSAPYKREVDDLQRYVTLLTDLMSRYSLPYFSPRYMGHMCFDNSLPATLGYLAAMIYNPNNVAVEASPLTSYVEHCVGQQLCKMLGYRTTTGDLAAEEIKSAYKGWGHLTCDGSVANLELLWVARNLKFYPLSLKWAIEEGNLGFIASSFTIPLTRRNAGTVLFAQAFTRDLLNLRPEVILDIPSRLSKEYGISQRFVDEEVGKYLVQTIGREPLERRYCITRTPKVLVSKMNHYSWPKGAAVLGIGRDNVHQIDVDSHARMDVAQLETELLSLVQAGHAIYSVVAIMGTTEHGAVDPLDKILSLRRQFQDEHGISFLIHCDAAWGGYFASLLHAAPPEYKGGRDLDDGGVYVPHQALSQYTETQLRSMRYADSITVDPHKSGYIPYPAGGLCYKDERLKYLITWTGPYIDGGASDVESMGVYGLEGSKPGAAPVAAYISNEVIGLHRGGYGGLLGEAMFTSVKMYAHWATMTLESDTLIVTPFNMLPAEREGKSVEEVEAQRAFIRRNIVDRPNRELVRDPEAMDLVRMMGSDLSINAFACNFRLSRGGPPNRDVAEASYLNRRIIERLSVNRVDDEACKKPVLLMGSELDQERYGSCLAGFKQRLGLNPGDSAPLAGLCNVSMTPFPTTGNFVRELADSFRKVAEEEVQNCWKRVHVVPAIHSFIMQGTEDLFLAYLPMFNWGSYRQQLIVSAKLPADVMETYVRARRERPAAVFSLHTSSQELLSTILQRRSCLVDVHEGLPMLHGIADDSNTLYRTQVELTDITIIKHVELYPSPPHSGYPPVMIFFLYGTPKEQHIDHMLLTNDNVQLSSSCVQLDFGPSTERVLSEIASKSGLMLAFDDLREHAMQPFGGRHKPDFFAPNRTFRVTLHMDPCSEYGPVALNVRTQLLQDEAREPITQGTITLGESVYVDYAHLNRDTVPQLYITPTEQLTRDQLLLSVTNDYQKIVDDIVRIVSHESASVAPDIEEHILARAALPSKYSLGKASDPQGTGTTPSKVHVSRFRIPHPSDAYSRQMAVRNGWKDMFDARVADCRDGN